MNIFFSLVIKLINYFQFVSINLCSLKTIPIEHDENIRTFLISYLRLSIKSKYIHRNGENTLLNIFRTCQDFVIQYFSLSYISFLSKTPTDVSSFGVCLEKAYLPFICTKKHTWCSAQMSILCIMIVYNVKSILRLYSGGTCVHIFRSYQPQV